MKKSDIRKTMSDFFNEGESVFGKKVTFNEAFSGIQELKIEVIEDGKGVGEWNEKRTYTLDRPPGEFINCSNKFCFKGGLRIADIIRDMVQNKAEHHETHNFCIGNEGSPKGRKTYKSCINSFKVTVDIKYKQN